MNGTMKPMSEYDKSGSWTGDAGTETNPYAVEDVYDFCAINSSTKENKYFMLVKDIDFNNHETLKYGTFNLDIVMWGTKAILLGNNHIIRNIMLNAFGTNASDVHAVFRISEIHDCKFENLIVLCPYHAQNRLFLSTTFVNCSFYIQLNNASLSVIFGGCKLSNSSLNIAGIDSDNGVLIAPTLERCHVNFKDLTVNAVSESSTVSRMFNGMNINMSYFTGSVKIGGGLVRENNYLFRNWITLNSFYFCASVTSSIGYNKLILFESVPSTVCFANTSLLAEWNVVGNAKFYALTDEQCRDVDYLSGVIGFPVIGV